MAGDGSAPAVLEAAGIGQANVLAAVTGEDEANLVITTLARFEFNVPRVIARVNNPKNAWLFTPEMGVDVALNQANILARLIAEEMSLGDMMTLLKLRKGEYSVVEEKVHPASLAAGQTAVRAEHPGRVRDGGHHPQGPAGDPARRHHPRAGRRDAGRGAGFAGLPAGSRPGQDLNPGRLNSTNHNGADSA